jgi:hypothetical protein
MLVTCCPSNASLNKNASNPRTQLVHRGSQKECYLKLAANAGRPLPLQMQRPTRSPTW